MEADTSRLESAIAGAESRLFNLEREFKTLDLLFAGKSPQNVVFPTGVSGFNQIFEVIAMPLAIVEAETAAGNHPFRIVITTNEDGDYKYTVTKGSITDGTNGDALPITGLDEDQDPSAGIVMIEGYLDENLVITGLSLSIGEESVQEVTMAGYTQSKIALILGKITMDTTVTPPVPTAWQAWTTSARACHGFLNGSLVKVFEAAPTHPESI